MWQKEKLLVLRNFSFCLKVFIRCLLQRRQNASTCGKWLNVQKEDRFSNKTTDIILNTSIKYLLFIKVSDFTVSSLSLGNIFVLAVILWKVYQSLSETTLFPDGFPARHCSLTLFPMQAHFNASAAYDFWKHYCESILLTIFLIL